MFPADYETKTASLSLRSEAFHKHDYPAVYEAMVDCERPSSLGQFMHCDKIFEPCNGAMVKEKNTGSVTLQTPNPGGAQDLSPEFVYLGPSKNKCASNTDLPTDLPTDGPIGRTDGVARGMGKS